MALSPQIDDAAVIHLHVEVLIQLGAVLGGDAEVGEGGVLHIVQEGDPAHGVAPGTPWEQVPSSWSCPLCGVDNWGTFAAGNSLTRAETAAMVARVARTDLRQTFTPADYTPFTAAGLKPSDVLFTNGTTAGAYLPYVQELIDGLEADCAAQGMEFNWFNTVDGISFLDYVPLASMDLGWLIPAVVGIVLGLLLSGRKR